MIYVRLSVCMSVGGCVYDVCALLWMYICECRCLWCMCIWFVCLHVCLWVCVCVVGAFVYVYACVGVCAYECVYTCVCVLWVARQHCCVGVCAYECVYTCVCVLWVVRQHCCVGVCAYECVYTCVCVLWVVRQHCCVGVCIHVFVSCGWSDSTASVGDRFLMHCFTCSCSSHASAWTWRRSRCACLCCTRSTRTRCSRWTTRGHQLSLLLPPCSNASQSCTTTPMSAPSSLPSENSWPTWSSLSPPGSRVWTPVQCTRCDLQRGR